MWCTNSEQLTTLEKVFIMIQIINTQIAGTVELNENSFSWALWNG